MRIESIWRARFARLPPLVTHVPLSRGGSTFQFVLSTLGPVAPTACIYPRPLSYSCPAPSVQLLPRIHPANTFPEIFVVQIVRIAHRAV